MTNVTSKYDSPLGLPGGPVIPAGATVFVEKWQFIKDHNVVKTWLEAGVIVAEENETAADSDTNDDNSDQDKDAENAEKDRLIAELAQFGIVRNKRYSVETLQEELDAALAAPSGEEGASTETGNESGAGDEGGSGDTSDTGTKGE